MPYLLTSESFQVVDGPYKGKKYVRGKTYADIPPTEKRRFKEVKENAERGTRNAEASPKPATQTAGKPATQTAGKSATGTADKKNAAPDDKPKTSARSGAMTVPEKPKEG